MSNIVRKSLNNREKCFDCHGCPEWLLTILPTRIKSVQSIVGEGENEQQIKSIIDLSPYQLNNSIPILNFNKENQLNSNENSFEYPNKNSFEDFDQMIYSPSNKQLINLLNQLKEQQQQKRKNEILNKEKELNECLEMNCLNKSIPLTNYCQKHFLKNDSKQILFVQCNLCQQLSIKQDNKNLLHFCSSF